MAKAAELTTTSYAILGLLAVKPWTTYELAQQMGRAMSHFWPRARSKVYEEPKKLVAHGLARASAEQVGKRPRTVYSITPKGRRALAAWARTGSAPPALEFEVLLKVFFAEHGTKDDLLATLRGLRPWLQERAALGVHINHAYLNGQGPFPERLPWLVLAGRFLDDFDAMVGQWADWATSVVEQWPDDVRDAAPDWAALADMARRDEEALERLRGNG
jgi:DNA-binding PadR family transcriptional regulator